MIILLVDFSLSLAFLNLPGTANGFGPPKLSVRATRPVDYRKSTGLAALASPRSRECGHFFGIYVGTIKRSVNKPNQGYLILRSYCLSVFLFSPRKTGVFNDLDSIFSFGQ